MTGVQTCALPIYVLIQVVYIVVLGIKVFSLAHFLVIGIVAFGAMVICRVLQNEK